MKGEKCTFPNSEYSIAALQVYKLQRWKCSIWIIESIHWLLGLCVYKFTSLFDTQYKIFCIYENIYQKNIFRHKSRGRTFSQDEGAWLNLHDWRNEPDFAPLATSGHPAALGLQGTAISQLSVPLKIRSPQIEFDVEKATQLQRHARLGILPREAGAFRQPKPYPRLPAWGWRRDSAALQSRLILNKQVNRTMQRLGPNRMQARKMIIPRPILQSFEPFVAIHFLVNSEYERTAHT